MLPIVSIALSAIGTKEILGKENNHTILGWFEQLGFNWIKDDETAWCSLFMNWVAWVAGVPRSGKLNARSWLDVGKSIKVPVMGDVVVFWRESPQSWKGHVGVFIKEDGDCIHVLGGNQDNEVKIKRYPKSRVLGYRRLVQV